MPTRQLPPSPSLDHLKHQAKDLLAAHAAQDQSALQRIREFHPRHHQADDAQIAAARFTLADAYLSIAREYGFASWTRLKAQVEQGRPPDYEAPHHERIEDSVFRHAVDLIDAGDAEGLTEHLRQHPDLVRQHVLFEGGNYFGSPSLLQFVAENPIRHGSLPPNIVDIARILLDAGAKEDTGDVGYTLALVSSGCVAREMGVQVALIDLLCDYRADPEAMIPALGHGEFEAVEAMIRRGARVSLEVAAGLGRTEEAQRLLPDASQEERHRALCLSAMFGRTEILRMLLEAGEDPNRYSPPGLHSHSVPLHQAVCGGHLQAVHVLVEHGARLDIRDILFDGTPLAWAYHCKQPEIEEYLRSIGAP